MNWQSPKLISVLGSRELPTFYEIITQHFSERFDNSLSTRRFVNHEWHLTSALGHLSMPATLSFLRWNQKTNLDRGCHAHRRVRWSQFFSVLSMMLMSRKLMSPPFRRHFLLITRAGWRPKPGPEVFHWSIMTFEMTVLLLTLQPGITEASNLSNLHRIACTSQKNAMIEEM